MFPSCLGSQPELPESSRATPLPAGGWRGRPKISRAPPPAFRGGGGGGRGGGGARPGGALPAPLAGGGVRVRPNAQIDGRDRPGGGTAGGAPRPDLQGRSRSTKHSKYIMGRPPLNSLHGIQIFTCPCRALLSSVSCGSWLC
eukprot:931804-Prorocentrum_minimum.AAC.1